MSAGYKEIEQIPTSIKLKNVVNKMAIEADFFNSKILIYNNENDVKFYIVSNEEMEDFLTKLKSAYVDLAKAVVTGFCEAWARRLIEKIFNIKSDIMNLVDSLSNGFEVIRNCCDDDEIEFKSHHYLLDNLANYKLDPENPFIKKRRETLLHASENEINLTDTGILIRPAILVNSTDCLFQIYLLGSDGSMKLLNILNMGEFTIRGLAKTLSDENEYRVIAQDAITGTRENIDSQIHEMIDNVQSGPYGQFPSNLPVFSFGKAMDYTVGQGSVSSGDLFDSLFSMLFGEMMFVCSIYNKLNKTLNVYLSGFFFNTTEFERIVLLQNSCFVCHGMNIRIIKGHYAACIGALNGTGKTF